MPRSGRRQKREKRTNHKGYDMVCSILIATILACTIILFARDFVKELDKSPLIKKIVYNKLLIIED